MSILVQIENTDSLIEGIKNFFIIVYTYIIVFKITGFKVQSKKTYIKVFVFSIILTIIYLFLKTKTNSLYGTIFLGIILSMTVSNIESYGLGHSILISIISFGINYAIFFMSVMISFIPNVVFSIENRYIGLFILLIIYSILIICLLKLKRLKNGVPFFNRNKNNEYFDMLILSVSLIVIFSVISLGEYKNITTYKIGYALIIFAIIMFITIQKSLQIYYKQKLLVQELEETKNELEKKNKEIKELEQENLNFSKTSHTLAHKQKALEYKLNQLINQSAKNEPTKNNTNASREDNITHQANKPENIETEQIQDIRERLAEISKDLYQNEKSTRLAQTGIKRIDDMLKYMQSESEKHHIKLELQITGNIHHMTNKIIEEKDLETLIADHVKNAIIAINHSKNENKSILVKLGKIEENYGLAIYDTGIEFEKETLENLGKKPSTTHAEEGGTGMGFMNTFDTINKYKASLIINEIGKEKETNYTKAIIIKFDQKNEFKIDSYRQQKSTRTAKK